MEEALNSTDNSLDEFVLGIEVLSLGLLIWISSEISLDLRGLDMAEENERMFKFASSLLSTTIQDSNMKKKSDKPIYCCYAI